MSTVILKFGGSSVADNIKLNIVADKIISLKEEFDNIVVVVSAQGKTTDKLLKEAQELSAIPNEREVDMLISTGEQVTAAKLSILLNRKGYKTISLTGWQAGICTNNVHKSAKIEQICPDKIKKELEEGYIVVVAGFQGINKENEITTLGRGGSDTTAVALQAGLSADKCYIFSDVDGIYSADPNIIKVAKKLSEISFEEMREISDAGAKVLHNRCIEIGNKFDCNIIAKSTFTNDEGTTICKKIENSEIKGIVKNDKLVRIKILGEMNNKIDKVIEIYQKLLNENIIPEYLKNNEKERLNLEIRVQKAECKKVLELLETEYSDYDITQNEIAKLSIVGYAITQDNKVLNKVITILQNYRIGILDINLTQSKIEIILEDIENSIVEELHQELIKIN